MAIQVTVIMPMLLFLHDSCSISYFHLRLVSIADLVRQFVDNSFLHGGSDRITRGLGTRW